MAFWEGHWKAEIQAVLARVAELSGSSAHTVQMPRVKRFRLLDRIRRQLRAIAAGLDCDERACVA